jgi:two-component system NtrC family sensor kinase
VPKPIGISEIQFTVENALRERRLKVRSRELERRLEISERLAMIGKLAAGVAHELNNPLDGVIRFVKLTLDTLEEGTDAREFQEDALRGLRRMSSIVKDLLTFSRNIALEVEEEGLERQLREAVSQVLATGSGRTIDVVYDLAVPDVRVPRGLFQVFQNIVKNAADSLEESGRIEIRAGIRDGEVFVAVADSGCGIPEELMDRVYEPFFTTKEVGQGTGLGLSIVNRIMERFGGGMNIESEVGRGTTVTVFLPMRPVILSRKEEGEAIDAEGLHTAG